jgi:hypothetical protein
MVVRSAPTTFHTLGVDDFSSYILGVLEILFHYVVRLMEAATQIYVTSSSVYIRTS